MPAAPATQADTTTSELAEPSSDGGDEPINLFEAAAQAGRSGGGARGAAGRPAGTTATLDTLTAASGAGAGAGGLGNLDFLRTNPQFQQLRQIVQTQPRMLEPILQQVGAGNPQLAALISQHPDQFLQLLSEDADEDAPLPPGAQAVSVTEAERDAIERVSVGKSIGFQTTMLRLLIRFLSYAVLASSEISSSRPILHATRMRKRPRISSSTNLLTRTKTHARRMGSLTLNDLLTIRSSRVFTETMNVSCACCRSGLSGNPVLYAHCSTRSIEVYIDMLGVLLLDVRSIVSPPSLFSP